MIVTSRPEGDGHMALAFELALLARLWRARIDRLNCETGHEGYSLIPLYYLTEHPAGFTQSELAAKMLISEPSLTRMVGKMLENELIERRRMVGDGRAWLVQITPKGREALQAYEVEARALRDHLFSSLPETDLQTTRRVLRGISRRLAD